ETLGVEWRKTPPPERFAKWVRRHRILAALIVSLLLVAGLVLAAELFRRQAGRQHTLAQQSKMRDLMTKADGEFLNGDAHTGLRLLAQILRESNDHLSPAEWLIN